jgi:hypothetical protein
LLLQQPVLLTFAAAAVTTADAADATAADGAAAIIHTFWTPIAGVDCSNLVGET